MTWTRVYQFSAEQQNTDDISLVGGSVIGIPTISSAQVKTGSYSYLLAGGPRAFGRVYDSYLDRNRAGYFFYHSGLGTTRTVYLYLAATSPTEYEGPNIGVRIDQVSGFLEIVRPTSGTSNTYETLASDDLPAALAATGTWIHVGVYHRAHETTGQITVRINGTTVLDFTGDTRMYGQGSGVPSFVTQPLYVWVMGSYAGGVSLASPAYVDDLTIDTSSDESEGAIPARTYDRMTPNLAGTNAEWTPLSSTNLSNIDDTPNDGDTTYNKALATALKDTFNFTNVTVPVDHIIKAMIPMVFDRRLDTETDVQIRLIAFDGVTYKNGADQVPELDYSNPIWERMVTQPDGTDWNETDANAMEFGFESRGTYL